MKQANVPIPYTVSMDDGYKVAIASGMQNYVTVASSNQKMNRTGNLLE